MHFLVHQQNYSSFRVILLFSMFATIARVTNINKLTNWHFSKHFDILLVILIMDVRQCPLLRRPLHLIAPPHHQAIHNIQRVVSSSFQHKSENAKYINCHGWMNQSSRENTFHQNCPTCREDRSLYICAPKPACLHGLSLKYSDDWDMLFFG